jgi:outer membrane protein assembly factor BamB
MRLTHVLAAAAVLLGFSINSQAEVFLCAAQSGVVSAQRQACPGKPAEPDRRAAYAAMSDEQLGGYNAQIDCIDRIFFDDGHTTGNVERTRLINRRLASKNLPPYSEEQFDAVAEQRTGERPFDVEAYSACDQELSANPEPNTGSSVTLLTRLPLTTLHTPQNKTATWLNWAYTRESNALYLRTSDGQTGYFSSGRGFLHAVDLNTGNALWRYAGENSVVNVAIGAERIYTLTSEQQNIRAHDRATGKVIAEHSQETIAADLQAVGDVVVYIDDNGAALVALDGKSLAERWRTPLASYDTGSLRVLDNTLLLLDDEYVLHGYDAVSGKQRWQQALGESGELNVGKQLLYLDRLATTLQTLDVQSGKITHTYRFGEEDNPSVDANTGRLYKNLDGGARLQGIDPQSGKTLWTYALPDDFGMSDMHVNGATLVAFNGEHTAVLIIDSLTGKLTDTLHVPGLTFSEYRTEPGVMLVGESALLVFP